MKARNYFLLAGLLALGGVTLARAFERVQQRTFTLPDAGTVTLDAYRGSINVVPGEGSTVQVTVHYTADSTETDKARQEVDAFQFDARQVGNTIVLSARNPREAGARLDLGKNVRPGIRFELQVPATCNLDLKTGEGGITVGSMAGRMKATSGDGSISFRQIDGSVEASTRVGDVVVSRCSGAVALRTVEGNVRVGTVGGRADLETVDGDIELQTARNVVTATSAKGDITAGFAQVAGESRLKTSVGDIIATVNPAAACSIQASSRWGRVFNRIPLCNLENGHSSSRLVGTYNGGGPLIELAASGGNVRIAAGEPLFED